MSGNCKRNLLFVVGMLLVGMLFWIRYVLPKQSPLADTVTLTFVCYTNIDNYGLRTDYAAAVFRLANRSSHPIAYRQVFLGTCHDGFWKREEEGQSFHTIVETKRYAGGRLLERWHLPFLSYSAQASFCARGPGRSKRQKLSGLAGGGMSVFIIAR